MHIPGSHYSLGLFTGNSWIFLQLQSTFFSPLSGVLSQTHTETQRSSMRCSFFHYQPNNNKSCICNTPAKATESKLMITFVLIHMSKRAHCCATLSACQCQGNCFSEVSFCTKNPPVGVSKMFINLSRSCKA